LSQKEKRDKNHRTTDWGFCLKMKNKTKKHRRKAVFLKSKVWQTFEILRIT